MENVLEARKCAGGDGPPVSGQLTGTLLSPGLPRPTRWPRGALISHTGGAAPGLPAVDAPCGDFRVKFSVCISGHPHPRRLQECQQSRMFPQQSDGGNDAGLPGRGQGGLGLGRQRESWRQGDQVKLVAALIPPPSDWEWHGWRWQGGTGKAESRGLPWGEEKGSLHKGSQAWEGRQGGGGVPLPGCFESGLALFALEGPPVNPLFPGVQAHAHRLTV